MDNLDRLVIYVLLGLILIAVTGCCHTHEVPPVVIEPVEYEISWWTERT